MIEIIALLIIVTFLLWSIWLILKEYKQTQDVISIESCMPKEQTINEQLIKMMDEFDEVAVAPDYRNLAEESLDVARTSFGMFELAVEEIAEETGLDKRYIKRQLIEEHYKKIEERRAEWNENS